MRKTLLAISVVAVPAILVYALLNYVPQLIIANSDETQKASALSKEFQSISEKNGTVTIKDDSSLASSTRATNYFYKNLHIDEIINKNTEFYTIVADTPLELRDRILEYAPENSNTTRKSITKVSYSFDWTLDTVQEADECKLYGAKVITNITLTMPRWEGIEKQTDDVRLQWGKYLENVVNYENRHNRIMEKVSHAIAERIRLIPKQAFCDDLIEKVNSLGSKGISDAKIKVKRYQSETGGGRLLGVQLPIFSTDDIFDPQLNSDTDK